MVLFVAFDVSLNLGLFFGDTCSVVIVYLLYAVWFAFDIMYVVL